MKYLIKKFCTLIITLFFISLLSFLAFQVIPGDAALSKLGTGATEQKREKLRREMGLDRPVLEQYGIWLKNFGQGNMGESYTYSLPVSEMIREKMPANLAITAMSFLMMLAVSIPLGLLKRQAKITSGSMMFLGEDLLSKSQKEWQALRGKEISMIFQEPMTSLNPVLTIGRQMEESLRLHTKMEAKERKKKALDMMSQVGLAQPEKLYRCYPHQLSGGMRQRVMIGSALIGNPKLMIADEPTTALDVTIQAQILSLLKKMNQEHGTAILFISHDLRVIQSICSRVVVMYQGKIVESGPVQTVLRSPQQAYTKKLLSAIPNRAYSLRRDRKERIESC